MTNNRGVYFFVIFQLRACYQLLGAAVLLNTDHYVCNVPDVLKKCSQQQRTLVSEAIEGGMMQW